MGRQVIFLRALNTNMIITCKLNDIYVIVNTADQIISIFHNLHQKLTKNEDIFDVFIRTSKFKDAKQGQMSFHISS